MENSGWGSLNALSSFLKDAVLIEHLMSAIIILEVMS